MRLATYEDGSGESVEETLDHGKTVTYQQHSSPERHSLDESSSVYWSFDIDARNFFEQIQEYFDPEDSAMANLADGYGATRDETHHGPIETDVGSLTGIEDFYNRVKLFRLEQDDYNAEWATFKDSSMDNGVSFRLKSKEGLASSPVKHFMDQSLKNPEQAYEEVRTLHLTDFEDLKARAD